jgi:SSS family solute:Na+ symporter
VTEPRPVEELEGLVYGMATIEEPRARDRGWYRSPALLGAAVLVMTAIASLFFI